MTDSFNSVTRKELVSVVMFSSGTREITLSNLKQLFSMKPEPWQLDVQLVIDSANEATLKLIDSLGLQIKILDARGKKIGTRIISKAVRNLPENSDAVLWLGANTSFKSDAYNQINNFHKQYPSAVLVGQFQDDASSQISAGGYSSAPMFGKKIRIQAQTLPVNVAGFDDNLIFIPTSAATKIGQPTGWRKKLNKHSMFVSRAKRKGIRCLAVPGFLGSYNQ